MNSETEDIGDRCSDALDFDALDLVLGSNLNSTRNEACSGGRATPLGLRYPLAMGEAPVTIRSAIPEDADGIIRVYMESAEYHAGLEPERYWLPTVETARARYREGQWHSQDAGQQSVTLVAELSGEIVGFVDAQLHQSPDPMHREITYCHIVEIAVSTRHQNQGIGERLLHAAEDWGRQQGAELASLEFLAVNARAATFYQRRMGYRPASITAIKRL